ncbi:hypothetical protein TELCIR_10292 [Teladorsagia circumcincta]|uniref:Major facilitator superfamily (MFS) profile domain-containing protein n=1 Tax=Teladorsagia circumcincta TaxID=45464 RepID=A0A2G9UCQ1_TELCI|nr:hypothetical protein TELCIR_10292 [Teladorsagia circumcincta]
MFWLFLLFRGIVGVGEASYAVISPSIIADMFTGENRSRMLMFFYFAIPCGSGLGFMVGSSVAALTGDWKWGVRITAVLGVICLLAIVVFIREPKRGGAEREKGEIVADVVASSYLDDLRSLATNLTYVFSTAGYTAIVFVVGTLTWWAPTAIEHYDASKHGLNSTDDLNPDTKAQVNLIFGAITCIGGIAGVGIGSTLAGAVVVPTRRNAANSWQILISHLCGDASGPYILGLISDAIRGDDDTSLGHFHSLVMSFYLPNVLLIVSAVLFFVAAYTFVHDQMKFQQEMGVISESSIPSAALPSSSEVYSSTHENKAFSPEETTKI